jgi:hypothetical protein
LVAALLTGCLSAPPAREAQPDGTAERWYGQTLDELTVMNRQATELFHKGKEDEAAALIQKGETSATRLLSVQHPTLAALEAVSDLDRLYGQMLFSNRNYGWARLLFQRNVARWKNLKPQTPESARRLKEAETAIAECDRRIGQ